MTIPDKAMKSVAKSPSLKKRNRAFTITPLHKPTRAQPRQPRLDRQPTAPACKHPKLMAAQPMKSVDSSTQHLPPSVHVEACRSAQMVRLRRRFTAIFKAGTPGNSPDAPTAFERWHFTQMLHQKPGKDVDPLIPTTCQQGALVEDLGRLSATPVAIRQAEQALANAARECVKAVRQQTGSVARCTPSIVHHKHSCDITYGKLLLKINPTHLDKLRAAYRAGGADSEQAFLDAVCALLLRYRSLGGHGFQAALNEAAMEVLASALGVSAECFASPLNNFFPDYFSAFPDTDTIFGSRGSFLANPLPRSAFDPRTGGSFECNPPFVPAVMLAAVEQLHRMAQQCDDAGGAPFSVVVVVPGWTEDAAWAALQRSSLLVKEVLVSKADHGFVDGAQHQRRDRYRESPFDTAVFVLQNAAGRRRWPVKADLEKELRGAMARGRPSVAAVQRRLKAGRGLADADGGGGVYRGKKKQKRVQEAGAHGGGDAQEQARREEGDRESSGAGVDGSGSEGGEKEHGAEHAAAVEAVRGSAGEPGGAASGRKRKMEKKREKEKAKKKAKKMLRAAAAD